MRQNSEQNQIQFCYVMKVRETNHKNKLQNTIKRKQKSKKKSKSKSKEKKFNPVEYLHALIDLQNTNFSTNKKKGAATRDISSALTIATPILQKTISSGKIRSKSSFSQYRKKNNGLKEAMKINLKDVITEQNVEFTENTSRSKKQAQINTNEKTLVKRNQQMCAIIIQRAWRNYKTYKMINKYYTYSRKQPKIEKDAQESAKFLKIKGRQNARKKKQEEGRKNPLTNRERQIIDDEPIKDDPFLQEIKEKQEERWNEVMGIIKRQSEYKSKDELLQDLIEKFEENKRCLEKDIQQELETSKINIREVNSEQSDEKSLKFIENINVGDAISEDSYNFDFENFEQTQPEFKIFQRQLKILSEKRNAEMERVKSDLQLGKITSEKGLRKNEQIYSRYERQRRQVEKSKKSYLFAMSQLKKNTLSMFKNASQFQKMNHSSSKLSSIRKSFSVGSIFIKSVISDISEFNIEEGKEEEISIVYENITPSKKRIESFMSNEISNLDKNNTELMKQYSEEIEEEIEKILINQFINQCYIDDHLFNYFRPYVEEIFQFKKISDEEIMNFALQQLPQHYPPPKELLSKINQKVNPTSLQILRIIRDIDYQIEEYDLIIPEPCFKRYRSKIQSEYESKNSQSKTDVKVDGKNIDLVEKIYKREEQRKEKQVKYCCFERDLKIMYMKSIFNCINEFLIETKSAFSYMNARSSIGPGELTLAIKEYNDAYSFDEAKDLFQVVNKKLSGLLIGKCSIPSFKNYNDLELFQKTLMNQIKNEYVETEYKWVNYMDEVLQIWQDLCGLIVQEIFNQATNDILFL